MTRDPRYRVSCEKGRFADRWVVWRVRDGAVMTEATFPTSCLEWVSVWGPMLHDAPKSMRVPEGWRARS